MGVQLLLQAAPSPVPLVPSGRVRLGSQEGSGPQRQLLLVKRSDLPLQVNNKTCHQIN